MTEDDGKKKTTTEVVYSESEIDRQVYRIAEEAVNGTTETEETKQWLQDNILAPVDSPEELPEEPACFKVCRMAEAEAFFKRISVS